MKIISKTWKIAFLTVVINLLRKILYFVDAIYITYVTYQLYCYSCIIWLKYGMLLQDKAITIVNIIGVILESVYVVIYYMYLNNKVSVVSSCCIHDLSLHNHYIYLLIITQLISIMLLSNLLLLEYLIGVSMR